MALPHGAMGWSAVPRVIVLFPDHSHLLFATRKTLPNHFLGEWGGDGYCPFFWTKSYLEISLPCMQIVLYDID